MGVGGAGRRVLSSPALGVRRTPPHCKQGSLSHCPPDPFLAAPTNLRSSGVSGPEARAGLSL